MLQPVVVRRVGEMYEIVAGERRWRASAQAELQEIPCVVKELSDADTLKAALVENLQRCDLDPLEEASAFHRLMQEYDLTQAQVAQAVGKSRSAVANSMRLLRLPEPVLAYLAQGALSPGHARALMTLASENDTLKLAESAVQRRTSVRDLEAQARRMNRSARRVKKQQRTPAEVSVEERLTRSLNTKVRLHSRKGKGRVEIFFHSLDQLDDLLERLAP